MLVTGAAGFIGFHVAARLLADGHPVIGLDNLNDYYDPALKEARLAQSHAASGLHLRARGPPRSGTRWRSTSSATVRARVVHLAAQAGVRYSTVNPHAYLDSNLVGFLHLLEECRRHRIEPPRVRLLELGVRAERPGSSRSSTTTSTTR